MAKAKAYRAKHDVSFPRVLSRSGEGDNLVEATEGVNYPAGSIIRHDSLPRSVKQRVEDDQLDWVLDPLNDEEASESEHFGDVEPEFGIFVAEHEAEQHALEAYGHRVVPRDQVLEALSSGQEHTRRYQQAAKEAGLDRRPNQEFLAQERERVPEHVLTGAETPSGTLHDRGPGREEPSDEGENESEQQSGEESQTARPRPAPETRSGPEAPSSSTGQGG